MLKDTYYWIIQKRGNDEYAMYLVLIVESYNRRFVLDVFVAVGI